MWDQVLKAPTTHKQTENDNTQENHRAIIWSQLICDRMDSKQFPTCDEINHRGLYDRQVVYVVINTKPTTIYLLNDRTIA